MNAPVRGRLITLEGIEGVGKSTHLRRVVDAIEAAGYDVDLTREPGGTPTAEAIRALLIEHGEEPIPPAAEALLMFASRALHIANRIRPSLEQGSWVVSDRYVDASRAYQGAGRGIPDESIETLARLALDGLEADATLLLDCPVDIGMARAGSRGDKDRFEVEEHAFFERIRAKYLSLAAADPERFYVVDASGTLDEVAAGVDAAVQEILIRFK